MEMLVASVHVRTAHWALLAGYEEEDTYMS
jgi:hypothetical protein